MAEPTHVEKAILKTLAYRDVFDFPLTAQEIHRFLIGGEAPQSAVNKILDQLVGEGKIENKNEYYFLPGRQDVVGLRREREKISENKLGKTRRYADLFRPFPWVKAIFASGAAAVGNADEGSDLDVLIVTAPRRLWLSRFWIFSALKLLGVKRPYDGTSICDKVCPNILLAETVHSEGGTLRSARNLYTAHEVVNLKPVWEKDSIHQRFLAENSWIKDLLPNVDLPSQPGVHEARGLFLWDPLEELFFKLQVKYMQRRKTREVTTPERIFFHPIDKTKQVLTAYQKRLVALSLD